MIEKQAHRLIFSNPFGKLPPTETERAKTLDARRDNQRKTMEKRNAAKN